jgi:hypothetical protein
LQHLCQLASSHPSHHTELISKSEDALEQVSLDSHVKTLDKSSAPPDLSCIGSVSAVHSSPVGANTCLSRGRYESFDSLIQSFVVSFLLDVVVFQLHDDSFPLEDNLLVDILMRELPIL